MDKVEQVFIIANGYKEKALTIANDIKSYLESNGVKTIISAICDFTDKTEVPRGTGLLVSIGGDGTVLYSAQIGRASCRERV